MRPRYQQGQIMRDGQSWVLRYYEDRLDNGQRRRVRTKRVLCSYTEHPLRGTDADLEFLRKKFANEIATYLAPENKNHAITMGAITLGQFIEHSYWPRCEERFAIPAGNELHLERSTIKGYRDIYRQHIEPSPIAKLKLQDFTPAKAQHFIESLDQNLSHKTHMRIKNFLSGILSWAIVSEAYRGVNPMTEVKAGGRTKGPRDLSGLPESERIRKQKIAVSNDYAYTLEEVAEMINKLPDPARTVCALSAFTGLTRSELWGLKREDYDGERIHVRRKIVGGIEGAPKTEAREDSVYIIPPLRKLLANYVKAFPSIGAGWFFRGRKGGPLNLENLARDISIHLNGSWHGFHAFRRGLGTRLNAAGVDDKNIQSILRHADVGTTMAYYVQPDREGAERGLRKLGKAIQKKYKIKW